MPAAFTIGHDSRSRTCGRQQKPGVRIRRGEVDAEIGTTLADRRISHRSIGSGVSSSSTTPPACFWEPRSWCQVRGQGNGGPTDGTSGVRRPAGLGHYRECLDVDGAVLRQRIGGEIAIQIDLPRHQIVKRRCAATIGKAGSWSRWRSGTPCHRIAPCWLCRSMRRSPCPDWLSASRPSL